MYLYVFRTGDLKLKALWSGTTRSECDAQFLKTSDVARASITGH